MESDNPFFQRAKQLLETSSADKLESNSDLMVFAHVKKQGVVPSAPRYALTEAAHLLWTLSTKFDPSLRIEHPRITITSCEVCGAVSVGRGWCRKHYAIARNTRNALAPFLSPAPPSARIGRPPNADKPEKNECIVRVSYQTALALDMVRDNSSRSLAAEAILRSALGLAPTKEMLEDSADS